MPNKDPNDATTTNWLSDLDDRSTAELDAPPLRSEEPPGTNRDDAPKVPRTGSNVGEYVIAGELGRGGMGVVYRAFDPRLRRHVALKLMLHMATPARVRRFREEAQVTAQLQHPSIVPIYDVGQSDNGELYYTMRLVQGPTLTEVVAEHRLSLSRGDLEAPEGWTLFRLLQVFVTVCRAVSYAHDREVAHRDLKPGNVMIGTYGEVNVLDWGLAKFLGTGDGLTEGDERGHRGTQAGTVVGTPAFMAPEQARRRSPEVGVATDVYCLGGILFYILTGRPPRDGTPAQVMEQLTSGQPPVEPQKLEPSISPELGRLCMDALASAPSERIRSARLLADAAEAYLEGRSLATPRSQDAAFLRGYSSRHYRRPSVTVDVAVMTAPEEGRTRVALLCRDQPPFVGSWACPGTFVRLEEPLEETAKRVLLDKVSNPSIVALDQIGAFGDPGRDPRTRVITVAYLAIVEKAFVLPTEPITLAWFDISQEGSQIILRATDTRHEGGERVELAFDHANLLLAALRIARRAE